MDNFDELDRKGFLGLYRQMSGYIRVETELRNDEEERNFIMKGVPAEIEVNVD